MSSSKKYRLNAETLLYEVEKVSLRSRFMRFVAFIILSVLIVLFYFWLFTSVFRLELPKTVFLKMQNAAWISRMDIMNTRLDRCENALEGLEIRDNDVYRNIFGLNSVSSSVRNSGFGEVERYEKFDLLSANSKLKSTEIRLDKLMKKTYVQSKSFDEVEAYSRRVGDMASCIPAICPLDAYYSKYRLSSTFGYRSDPFTGMARMHTGLDLSCKSGNPVYVTGNGVVEQVSFELFGYGNSIIVNHGFGYKTRYAHLSNIFVTEGMKLKRGECIGESGKSGRASGPHLHYEVIYKNNVVNPMNYFDPDMSKEDYENIIHKAAEESDNVIIRPHTRFVPKFGKRK